MEQLVPHATAVTTTPTPATAPQQHYAGPSYPPMPRVMLSLPEHDLPLHLQAFWASQMQEIKQMEEIKNCSLPLARIKKIMKSDEDIKMIAGEVPVVFARACEMFILEMTIRAWNNTAGNKRRTVQKCDIAAAVSQTDIFDFLVDIVPRDDFLETARTEVTVPYFYIPSQLQDAGAVGAVALTQMEQHVDHHA